MTRNVFVARILLASLILSSIGCAALGINPLTPAQCATLETGVEDAEDFVERSEVLREAYCGPRYLEASARVRNMSRSSTEGDATPDTCSAAQSAVDIATGLLAAARATYELTCGGRG